MFNGDSSVITALLIRHVNDTQDLNNNQGYLPQAGCNQTISSHDNTVSTYMFIIYVSKSLYEIMVTQQQRVNPKNEPTLLD